MAQGLPLAQLSPGLAGLAAPTALPAQCLCCCVLCCKLRHCHSTPSSTIIGCH
jgi:hypothetical protein